MLIICCGILLLTYLLDITLIKGQVMHVGCLYFNFQDEPHKAIFRMYLHTLSKYVNSLT